MICFLWPRYVPSVLLRYFLDLLYHMGTMFTMPMTFIYVDMYFSQAHVMPVRKKSLKSNKIVRSSKRKAPGTARMRFYNPLGFWVLSSLSKDFQKWKRIASLVFIAYANSNN